MSSFNKFLNERLLVDSTLMPGRSNLTVMVGTVVLSIVVSEIFNATKSKK